MNKGFVLLEVSIAYVILGVALIALVPIFILAIKANKSTEKIVTATYLSSELLEEVRMRKFDENTLATGGYAVSISSSLGRETGESSTDKTTYDDVDDFNNYIESGTIKDPLNRAISGFPSFTRSVTVQWVDSSSNVSAVSTDYKKITVCTKIPNRTDLCLSTLVTNH